MSYSMMTWQPTANLNNLRIRAEVIAMVRNFFAARQVLEVETPLLSAATVTDPHLHSMTTTYALSNHQQRSLYLQTSPEFAMKRLLSAGSGPIYQIGKAFRNNGEFGRHHNPEFTLLEWYRPNFNHHNLMDEVDDLLMQVLRASAAERMSYAEVFAKYLDIEPHTADIITLKKCAMDHNIDVVGIENADRDTWLQLLMSHVIEPKLGWEKPTFIYDFPASQAALARVRNDKPPVAERFEVYVQGIELANGYHELADSKEQQRRFNADLAQRKTMNLPLVNTDQYLLAALEAGFPDCAGVALGIDRLVMLVSKANQLAEVISFTIERA